MGCYVDSKVHVNDTLKYVPNNVANAYINSYYEYKTKIFFWKGYKLKLE